MLTKMLNLTRRERQIMEMFSHGYSAKEIGSHLFISLYTVETHRKHLIEKLGARNMPHAVRLALQKGVLEISQTLQLIELPN
ncbi:MAG: helix-turn-helix transcriptional regulator [Chitinophagales bacterium]